MDTHTDRCGWYEPCTLDTQKHILACSHSSCQLCLDSWHPPTPSPAHTAPCLSSLALTPLPDGPGTSVGDESITDGPGVLGPVFGTGSQADGVLGPGRNAPLCAVQLQSCWVWPGGVRGSRVGSKQRRAPAQPREARPCLSPVPTTLLWASRALIREQALSQEMGSRELPPDQDSGDQSWGHWHLLSTLLHPAALGGRYHHSPILQMRELRLGEDNHPPTPHIQQVEAPSFKPCPQTMVRLTSVNPCPSLPPEYQGARSRQPRGGSAAGRGGSGGCSCRRSEAPAS